MAKRVCDWDNNELAAWPVLYLGPDYTAYAHALEAVHTTGRVLCAMAPEAPRFRSWQARVFAAASDAAAGAAAIAPTPQMHAIVCKALARLVHTGVYERARGIGDEHDAIRCVTVHTRL